MIQGRQVGGEKWKTLFAIGQWSLCAVRAPCFVLLRAGGCLLKLKCGTTRRWKKSRPALSNATTPRRTAHLLMQRRFPMHPIKADCWRVETFLQKPSTLMARSSLKAVEPGFPFRNYHDHPR